MIDEQFLQSAVQIRRTYLKLNNNLEFYTKEAAKIVTKLETTLTKIDDIQNSNKDNKSSFEDLLKIMNEIESEGKLLEDLINPLNKKIEKLALEEQELYRSIKRKHPDLTDDDIVESVKQRLIKENLS
jgi:uncharacterized coiled-coil DUF342 family protein